MVETAEAMHRTLIESAETLSRTHMDAYQDPSHDWLHVQRVRALALKIASGLEAQGHQVDRLVVELAALFHDLHDSKYASATANIWDDLNARFFRAAIAKGQISESRARLACQICENVSYSKEVKRIKAGLQTEWHKTCQELHCVQDADKLDAMGGIGIMRCAAFSASKKRPLLQEGNPEDSISHFHDKLLKLKSMMRTELGLEYAQRRHETMLHFLEQVKAEQAQMELEA